MRDGTQVFCTQTSSTILLMPAQQRRRCQAPTMPQQHPLMTCWVTVLSVFVAWVVGECCLQQLCIAQSATQVGVVGTDDRVLRFLVR